MTRPTTAPNPVTVRARVYVSHVGRNTDRSRVDRHTAHGMTTLQSSLSELLSSHRTVDRAMVEGIAEAKRASARHGIALLILGDFECDGVLMTSTRHRVIGVYVDGEAMPRYHDELPQHLTNCYRRGEF